MFARAFLPADSCIKSSTVPIIRRIALARAIDDDAHVITGSDGAAVGRKQKSFKQQIRQDVNTVFRQLYLYNIYYKPPS